MRLTKAVVESAKYPEKGQRFLRDGVDVGLALRITPGAKTFILERRIDGRVVRGALGQYPDFTLAAARERARQYKGDIANGINPFEERLKARRAEREALTFGDLAQRYIEEYARDHRKSWQRDKKRLDRHFGHLNRRGLDDITPGVVNKALITIKGYAGPVEANRAVQLLRSVFRKAKELKWYLGEDPVIGGKGYFFEEHERERVLSPEEAERVGRALAEERDWRWPAYITLDLCLSLRKGELLSARWSYFDFETGIMRIPKTKSGRSLILPIPQRALPLLMALPSRRKSDFLFPGTGKSGHLADARSGWERIRKKAKVEDVTVHDLRRTAASWVTRQTGDLQVTQKMLNHKKIASTEIYARLLIGPLREAMEDHTETMLSKLGAAESPKEIAL